MVCGLWAAGGRWGHDARVGAVMPPCWMSCWGETPRLWAPVAFLGPRGHRLGLVVGGRRGGVFSLGLGESGGGIFRQRLRLDARLSGCTAQNSLWESIRVIRLVVGHDVLWDMASLRAVSRERGEGGGVGEAGLKWCRVELFSRLSAPTRYRVPTGNVTATRGIDDVAVGVVVGRVCRGRTQQ